MILDVPMPNQGLTITEATLVRWARQPGERVRKGDILFEIETDKAVQEVESPESGIVLEHLAQEGEVIPLGQVVAKIEREASFSAESAAPSTQRAALSSGPVAGGEPAQLPGSATGSFSEVRLPPRREGLLASPRARRTAQRLGIDLAVAQPTGRRQHIRERDVLMAAERLNLPRESDTATIPTLSPLHPSETPVPPGRLRRLTAERTTASFRDTPHFYLTREVSAERLATVRAELVQDAEALGSGHVSLTDLFLRALALGLRKFPALNAQWKDGGIVSLASVDIGLAVDTTEGLIVPVIQAADRLSVCALAERRQELVQRAKARQSRPEDLVGGSFTLSNLGAFGVDQFEAIIVPPQSGILAVGTVKPRPYVVEEQLTVCKTVFLTLSVDHRVVDGAEAGKFLQYLAHLIERPTLLCAL